MIPLCFVHVGDQPGRGELMSGDITLLERLLPNVAAVGRLTLGRQVRLTTEEAGALLKGLQGLDLTNGGDDRYVRSPAGRVQGTPRGLIEPFIQFLLDELKASGSRRIR